MGAATTPAQSQVTLFGRVADDRGRPLEDAEVYLGGLSRTTRTDRAGRFVVRDLPIGLFHFGVRRIGYEPVVELHRFVASDTLEVVLVPIGVRLDTVRVQAQLDAAWEVEMRRIGVAVDASRLGAVLTDADIRARRAVYTSDLFTAIHGYTVQGGGNSARVLGRAGCTPTLVLDGLIAPSLRLNDVSPRSIRLLITFRSQTTMPAAWQTPSVARDCGAIAIFTH
jgi:hypothetical protein